MLPFASEGRGRWGLLRACCAVAVSAALLLAGGGCGPKTAPKPVAPPPPAGTGAQAAPASPIPSPSPVSSAPTGSPAPVPAPPPLLGHVTPAALKAYAPWAVLWEQPYVPDPAAVAVIKSGARNVTVLLVMGTWCPDSKRELPRYFATMDAAGLGDSMLTMVGVDRTKKDTEGLTERYEITRVPTFVFFRDGKEIGRFVERTPVGSSFEAEVAKILGGGRVPHSPRAD